MRPPLFTPIVRLRVTPDEPADGPAAMTAPRPRGSRRPHTDAKVAAVRRLIEETALTYGQIAARTGVGRASICRWTRDQGWKRHPFAPRATDMIPRPRASAQLKRRTLAARLDALAERYVRELEEAVCVDPDKLAEALELLKMAKLAPRPGRRRRKRDAASEQWPQRPEKHERPIMQLVAADVSLRRVPRAAVEDFLAHREQPAEPPPRRRVIYDRHHVWLLEKER